MPDLNLLVIKTGQLAEHAAFYAKLGFQFDYHRHGMGPYYPALTAWGYTAIIQDPDGRKIELVQQ